MPCQFIIGNRRCKIHTSNQYCHIHNNNSKLITKLKNQREELSILNKRLVEANHKLYVIDEVDRIKMELRKLGNCSFKFAILNPNNKEDIERIFNAPFDKCLDLYIDLRNQRNEIAHKYTRVDWDKNTILANGLPRARGRTLEELSNSLRCV